MNKKYIVIACAFIAVLFHKTYGMKNSIQDAIRYLMPMNTSCCKYDLGNIGDARIEDASSERKSFLSKICCSLCCKQFCDKKRYKKKPLLSITHDTADPLLRNSPVEEFKPQRLAESQPATYDDSENIDNERSIGVP